MFSKSESSQAAAKAGAISTVRRGVGYPPSGEGGPAGLQYREFARAFAVAVAERRKEVTQTELISLN